MTSRALGADVRPPRQARSRAAQQKLLLAAEDVLVSRGLEEFTIAAVAEHAGVSVGGVYRRFAGKEQLIDAVIDGLLMRVQDAVTQSLRTAEPSLAGVVGAFTQALATSMSRSGRVASALTSIQKSPEVQQRALRTLTVLERLFLDAAGHYSDEIVRSARSSALCTAMRTIIAAAAHRSDADQWWPDGLTWPQWADEIADMATTYLTRPESQPISGARRAPSGSARRREAIT